MAQAIATGGLPLRLSNQFKTVQDVPNGDKQRPDTTQVIKEEKQEDEQGKEKEKEKETANGNKNQEEDEEDEEVEVIIVEDGDGEDGLFEEQYIVASTRNGRVARGRFPRRHVQTRVRSRLSRDLGSSPETVSSNDSNASRVDDGEESDHQVHDGIDVDVVVPQEESIEKRFLRERKENIRFVRRELITFQP